MGFACLPRRSPTRVFRKFGPETNEGAGRGGGVLIWCLPWVIRPLTTHPFREAPFLTVGTGRGKHEACPRVLAPTHRASYGATYGVVLRSRSHPQIQPFRCTHTLPVPAPPRHSTTGGRHVKYRSRVTTFVCVPGPRAYTHTDTAANIRAAISEAELASYGKAVRLPRGS